MLDNGLGEATNYCQFASKAFGTIVPAIYRDSVAGQSPCFRGREVRRVWGDHNNLDRAPRPVLCIVLGFGEGTFQNGREQYPFLLLVLVLLLCASACEKHRRFPPLWRYFARALQVDLGSLGQNYRPPLVRDTPGSQINGLQPGVREPIWTLPFYKAEASFSMEKVQTFPVARDLGSRILGWGAGSCVLARPRGAELKKPVGGV